MNLFATEEGSKEQEHDANSAPNFLLVHKDFWTAITANITCKQCKTGAIKFRFTETHGFVKKVVVVCETCQETINQAYTSSRVAQAASSKRPPFTCNRKIVDSFLDIGTGYSGIQRFGAAMGMEIMSIKAYMDHMKKIVQENESVREEIFMLARQKVREAHEAASPELCDQEILDIAVSFDGSWAVTGFNSPIGFAGVIDILTGLVLDIIIFSKNCQMCALKLVEYDAESQDFKDWFKVHSDSGECDKNFDGSSQSMEMYGAEVLWKRSIQNNKMKYVIVLSDGDSKTVSHLNKIKPYGPDVTIEKEECTNHLSKRVGTALRNLVTEEKARKVTLGGRKEGALTGDFINHLQKHYHGAIKKNLPSVPETKKAINATIYHYNSTDQKPKHQHCPAGQDSWCFYNRAKAQKLKPGKHKDNMSHYLNDLVFKKIEPIYKRLSSDELLERCARMGTQNANESLHNVIWTKCRKGTSLSKKRYEVGITRGVGEFNMGVQKMLEVRLEVSSQDETNPTIAQRLDRKRKLQSDNQEERTKRRAIQKGKKKKQQTRNKKKEGVTYAAGAF